MRPAVDPSLFNYSLAAQCASSPEAAFRMPGQCPLTFAQTVISELSQMCEPSSYTSWSNQYHLTSWCKKYSAQIVDLTKSALGLPPLHAAIAYGVDSKIVNFLIDLGADVAEEAIANPLAKVGLSDSKPAKTLPIHWMQPSSTNTEVRDLIVDRVAYAKWLQSDISHCQLVTSSSGQENKAMPKVKCVSMVANQGMRIYDKIFKDTGMGGLSLSPALVLYGVPITIYTAGYSLYKRGQVTGEQLQHRATEAFLGTAAATYAYLLFTTGGEVQQIFHILFIANMIRVSRAGY